MTGPNSYPKQKAAMRKYHEEFDGQFAKAAGLYQARRRSTYGQFIAEGPQSVREALRHARESIRDVYISGDALHRHPDIAVLLDGIWTHVAPPEVLDELPADAQGVVAVVDKIDEPDVTALLDDAKLVVLAVEMQDPGNAGTLIRTADAAGADLVLMGSGSTDVYSPKVVRASAGSVFHLPIAQNLDPAQIISLAQGAGLQVLAADGEATAQLGGPEVDLGTPTLWLLGNEARGLPGELLTLADLTVAIPIRGKAESLNVAAAAAVCLYSSVLMGANRD